MIKVQIPATSANIGSGFDSLGLAVTMYNTIEMEESDFLDIQSLDDIPIPVDENNLVYHSVKYIYDLCGKPLKGMKIRQTNRIPMARGLGSSSACIVGGIVAANHLLGSPLCQRELVNIAATMEGHPDNSTPALLGGLVTAVLEKGKVYYVKQAIAQDLRFVAIIPNFELKTSFARQALPRDVSHKDAVFNLSRSALMSVSLYSGNYHNLKIACDDRLHQPYRLSLIDGAHDVFDLAYHHGAYAVYISGAGSTIMAIVNSERTAFVQQMRTGCDALGLNQWQIHELSVANVGARVLED